jgi:hypothetical protein
MRGSVGRQVRAAAVFAAAALITAAWPIWVFAQAPDAVLLNMVTMPTLCGQWLHELHMAYDKVTLTLDCLTSPAYVMLIVLAGIVTWGLRRGWSGLDRVAKTRLALAICVPLAFVVIAFIPPTMWRQYWGIPVPFLVAALAYPLADLQRATEGKDSASVFRIASYAVIICVVVTIGANVDLLGQSIILLVPERWAPVQVHAVAEEIATEVEGSKPILTLGPLYALEADTQIYLELSCGDLIYRIADSLSPREREITHTVGPDTLAYLVNKQPPGAVLVGVEPSYFSFLEDPLRHAIPSGWPSVDCGDGLYLYVPAQPETALVSDPQATVPLHIHQ